MTVTVDRVVEEFTAAPRKLFIDGQWTDAASGKTFETPNPATEETLANVAEGDAEDINRAVSAARKAFESGPWSRMTPSERGRLIWKIGDLILENAEELAQLESLDNGKPVGVALAADVPLAADLFHYMAGWATKIEGNTIDISGHLQGPRPGEEAPRRDRLDQLLQRLRRVPAVRRVQAVRLGPRDGPRGPRGLHRGQGGNDAAVTTPRSGAGPRRPHFAVLA